MCTTLDKIEYLVAKTKLTLQSENFPADYMSKARNIADDFKAFLLRKQKGFVLK